MVPESGNPSSADSSNIAVIAPQIIHFPETSDETGSAPATAVELALLDQSSANSPTPLECPVIFCRKTFKFKRDIQYHWTVSFVCSQTWLLISDSVTRMIIKDNA